MRWEQLLSKSRLCVTQKETTDMLTDGRSEFQRDFDRIVFSSAFRRLQDKTQVFPMPESDFVHNRLTHSLEVSCIGRSLGNMVGEKILDRHKDLNQNYTKFHFGEIVAAACLAHDIGNPPFGHSGEDAISEYFRNAKGSAFEQEIKDKKQWCDLVQFEGNAQGFRIITRLQNPKVHGSLQLTAATLAAFSKYPRESSLEMKNAAGNKALKKKIYKKYGFFQSEKEFFLEIAEKTGLKEKVKSHNTIFYCRHPLSLLVEAADDICYRVMDLEDGFHLGLMSFNETEELLMALIHGTKLKAYEERDKNDKIGYLRSKAMNGLVNQLTGIFIDSEKEILDGKLDDELINLIPSSDTLQQIKDVSIEKIYSFDSVIEREAAGYEVLGGLLDIFITAINEDFTGKTSHKNKKILQLLPVQFLNNSSDPDQELYSRLLRITDFVSGMTDTFAVSLFRKIKGISLSGM